MKNLKKVLALALVFAMTLTLFAGAAFSDQDSIGVDYLDDVNMLVELGVLKGYEDNSFRPENNVTRAEFAKMAYTLKYGYDDQGQLFIGQKSSFTDVEGVSAVAWAKGYINYCANQKVISGVGNNLFNPNGNVTVAEAAKMLLVILGCDPQTEGLVGANWQGNTVAKAIELGVFDGWVGDPTAPASRQLVAKLMRNTIFAPIYVYSPITGAGSQKQTLNPDLDNITLGEQTMGLQHETGLVVANERYAIITDDEGELFSNSANIANDPSATNDEDKSIIAYKDSDDEWDLLTINVGLEDDAIGTLVDVYYAYDKETKQYEVIGNVLTSAKTVIYEVAAADIDIYPNGESRASGTMKPEISFTTEDGELSIAAPAGTARETIKNNVYDGAAFVAENMFYNISASARGDLVGQMNLVTDVTDDVVTNMGENVLTTYRLISVDGGANISYIISNPNVSMGLVTGYNEAKGTINASQAIGSNNDLEEDVVVYDGIKKGDFVVARAENGKAVLSPATSVTGAVSSYSKDTAVIDGTTYTASNYFLTEVKESTLADYYASNIGKGTARGATYIVYNDMLLKLDEDAAVDVDLGNYAVVLKSSQDEDTGEATVKLGLSDGTEATYTVSYFVDINGAVYDAEETDFSAQFAQNSKVGYIVSYDIRNGTVELTEEVVFQSGDYSVVNNGINYANSNYWSNDNSTIFLLYTTSVDSRNVRFKTYKIAEMSDRASDSIPVYTQGSNYKQFEGAALMPVSKNSTDILMAVMTYGASTPSMLSDGEAVGYVVNSMVEYDADSRKNYLEISLIGMEEKELISGAFKDAKTGDMVGSAGAYQEGTAKYAIGSIAQYAHDGTDFTALDVNVLGSIAHQETKYSPSNNGNDKIGFFKVTIADATKSRISFYAYGDTALADQSGVIDNSKLQTLSIDEYKYDVVAIMDDEPAGEEIEEISKYDEVTSTTYNAIIEIDSAGKVVKVFSLHGLIG